jgi:predicted ATPase
MGTLAEEFQQYAERGGQVFVSTHSPDFLNAVPPESIFWLEKPTYAARGSSLNALSRRICQRSKMQTISQRSLTNSGPGNNWKPFINCAGKKG